VAKTMSLPVPTIYSESDIKFLEECAKIRGSNGSPVVSKGGKNEYDYDESKEIIVDDTIAAPYWFVDSELRKAAKKYTKPQTKEMDLKELFEIATAIKRQKKKVKPHTKTT
jgi:hypothetical protein